MRLLEEGVSPEERTIRSLLPVLTRHVELRSLGLHWVDPQNLKEACRREIKITTFACKGWFVVLGISPTPPFERNR